MVKRMVSLDNQTVVIHYLGVDVCHQSHLAGTVVVFPGQTVMTWAGCHESPRPPHVAMTLSGYVVVVVVVPVNYVFKKHINR